jgi:hypothetical protein
MKTVSHWWKFVSAFSLVSVATTFPLSVAAQDSLTIAAQTTTSNGGQNSSSFKLPADVPWYDAKIDLTSGLAVTIAAGGTAPVGALIPAHNVETLADKPEPRQYKTVFFPGKSEIGLPGDVVPATATSWKSPNTESAGSKNQQINKEERIEQ